MDIKNFDSDIIVIQNIDDEDFIFEYDRVSGNPPYIIPAGEVRRFPRYLANHAIKHLIDKILQKKDKRTSDIEARREFMNQIVIGEEKYERAPEKSESQKQLEEIEALNKPSELDAILAKRKEEKKEPEEKPELVVEEEPKEKFEGLEKEEPEVKETKPMPTRREIYKYAEGELKMVIDDKTKKKLDKMKVTELIKELDYPMEDDNA